MASKSIFVNMVVKDLEKSKEFFEALGYKFNKQFTDQTAAALVISENIYSMLLTEAKWKELLQRDAVIKSETPEMALALSAESKEEVDQILEKALAAGAKEDRQATDYGFMYTRSFVDLDGHLWEYFWMDPSFVKPE